MRALLRCGEATRVLVRVRVGVRVGVRVRVRLRLRLRLRVRLRVRVTISAATITVHSDGCFSRPDQKRAAASREGATPAASLSLTPTPALAFALPTPSRRTAEAAIRSKRSRVTLGHWRWLMW